MSRRTLAKPITESGAADATPVVEEAPDRAGPGEALRRFVSRYLVFTGRASRSEFWWWLAAFTAVSVLLGVAARLVVPAPASTRPAAILHYSVQVSLLQLGWALLNFVGAASLTVRRLHDVGLRGWWWFIQLIPVLGSITLIVMVALPRDAVRGRADRDR